MLVNHQNLLFLGCDKYPKKDDEDEDWSPNEGDKPYLPYLKPYIGGKKVFVDLKPITTITEVEMYCRDPVRNITGVLSTSLPLLRKLTGRDKVSLDNYAGSYFKRNGIEYVFLDPLKQAVTVPYGKFLLKRYVSKLVSPESWLETPEFKWRVINQSNLSEAIQFLSSSNLIGVDIETFSNPLAIRCIGFTGVHLGSKSGIPECFSYCLPIKELWQLQAMREINSIRVPKVFQNGKYDVSYLSRFNAVPTDWYWDTATAFHAWYAELPKDLAFLQSFFVREAAYWKDLAESNDLETYYLYNAKDTWATVFVMLAWMREAPQWAKNNYLMEFPLNYPCHLSEMTGIKRDFSRMDEARKGIEGMVESRTKSLRTILGQPDFNANSPKQMVELFKILGSGDIKNRAGKASSDDKSMAKLAYRHPFNARIVDLIRGVPKTDKLELMGIRALRKAKSTYLRTDDDITSTSKGGAKEFNGRILYSLNPHGTDSGRLASKEHHFWCGFNIQNIPVGKTVKQTIIADEDFYIGEADLEQAETRDTAYITGDRNLIAAVTSDRDFHSHNTSAFFGVPYESVYDQELRQVINKALRNLAKRVNHGANYNMGAQVMVDTMGEKAIYEAAVLLNLPKGMTAVQIAQFLLDRFAATYPAVKKDYPEWIVVTIRTTQMLVGATGWTRYCFGDPKNKLVLNSLIAHNPQSHNAIMLNKAFMAVFNDIAINPKYAPYFKLIAQIHDSILFLYHKDHLYLPEMVRESMEIPCTMKDIKGVERTFTVPAALKLGKNDSNGNLIRARYWSETE